MLDAVHPIDVDDGERPVLPYGSWPSPISVAVAVAGSRGLAEVRPDGRDVLFLESRPDQGGRVALVRLRPDGTTEEAVPQDLNVRTRVHQYGGGAYAVRNGVIVLSEFAGNRLIVTGAGESAPRTLVDDPALRFADMELDPARDRVLAVMEDQRTSEQDPRNLVVAVSLLDGSLTELVAGHDFYSDPRLDRTGSRIAFLTWDRPNMPWDGSDLWVVDVQPDGRVGLPHHVAGGPDESIVQPTWSPDGSLVFVSDRTGWWNLYRWRSGASDPVALAPADAEFAGPQWVFGLHWFDIAPDGTIVAVASEEGVDTLHVLAPGEAAGRSRSTRRRSPPSGSPAIRCCASWAPRRARAPSRASTSRRVESSGCTRPIDSRSRRPGSPGRGTSRSRARTGDPLMPGSTRRRTPG